MKKLLLTITLLLSSTLTFAADEVLISSCVNKTTKSMRHINAPQACKRKEYLLTWNQKGVQGEIGPQGPQGVPGTNATNYCTQENLAGNWTRLIFKGLQFGGESGVGEGVKKVDAQGNFSRSLVGTRYDEASGADVNVKTTTTGTMLIKTTTPSCIVELTYTISEEYVNPNDTFTLNPPQTTTLSNFRLTNEGTMLREVVSEFVPAHDEDNGDGTISHIPDGYSEYVVYLEKANVTNY